MEAALALQCLSIHNDYGDVPVEGIVRRQFSNINVCAIIVQVVGLFLLFLPVHLFGSQLISADSVYAQDLLPIGQIQGEGSESSYRDRWVRFRGIVTGYLEDQNSRGTRFYTLYVQDVPGSEDGNPHTSDGIAVFAGARRPSLAIGDIATFAGTVTEYYGLTELDNNGLAFAIESRNNPLPVPVPLEPPADNEDAAAYLEQFEAMRVAVPVGTVVGPSHVGCGFSVLPGLTDNPRVIVSASDDPAGQIIGILHPSDVACDAMPAVATGDLVEGLAGPLTFHFERFKIVYQDPTELIVNSSEPSLKAKSLSTQAGQLSISTFNVNNFFDDNPDSGNDAEPVLTGTQLALKRAKIAAAIADGLNCPDFVAIQEVESEALLEELSGRLFEHCGFVYQVSHQESPDARGADLALLSNPTRILVDDIALIQRCTEVQTEVVDPTVACPAGQQPLFSRPPLQVRVTVDGYELVLIVNHFKSKRGGVAETVGRRLAQAATVNALVREIQQSEGIDSVVVLGDFNDYDQSAVMQAITDKGALIDALAAVTREERYSYIFDGASQLIDWILVSPALNDKIVSAGILHSNADYPIQLGDSGESEYLALRSSDHDVPYVIVDLEPEPTPSPPTPTPAQSTPDTGPTPWPRAPIPTVDKVLEHGTPTTREAEPAVANLGPEPESRPQGDLDVSTPFPVPDEASSSVWSPETIAFLTVSGFLLMGAAALLLAAFARRRT